MIYISDTYLQFTRDDGTIYFVSIQEYMDDAPDTHQFDCNETLFTKVGDEYVPLD
jgi:hypothetical protein